MIGSVKSASVGKSFGSKALRPKADEDANIIQRTTDVILPPPQAAGIAFRDPQISGADGSGLATQHSKAALTAPASAATSLNTVYDSSNPADATPDEARQALFADNLNVDGSGLKVGVISNSYNNQGGASQDIQNGFLPSASKIHIIQDESGSQPGDDEGRAMMEVVHDIAPGASLDFCTNTGTASDYQNGTNGSDVAFADAIRALAADGCKVICDDLSIPTTPWFQPGVINQAIEAFEQAGGTYVTCATNGRNASDPTDTSISDPAYQSGWSRTSVTLDFNGTRQTFNDALNFGSGGTQNITVAAGKSVGLEMQWGQPWGHATSNIELVVSENGEVISTATRAANQTPAGESVNLANCPVVFNDIDNSQSASDTTYQVSIINLSGADPGVVKYRAQTNGGGANVSIDGANAGTADSFHEDPDAITVGAVDAGNSPAFGNTPYNETFSSSGLNEAWFFDANGNPFSAPEPLSVVDISGIDDLETGVSGSLADFFGTSCATPSIAGVAALMLDGNSQLTQPDIQNLLEDSAIGMINPTVAGAGLSDAAYAVQFAETLQIQSFGSNVNLGGTHLNDRFYSDGTKNTFSGFAGNDTYYISDPSDVVVEASGQGVDTVVSTVSYSIANDPYVENLILSGTAAINGTGNTFGNVITGNAAANVIVGGGGADTMTGGAGNDTYSVDNAGDKVIEAAGGGTDTVSASVSYALAADTSVNNLYVSGGINGTAAVNLTGNGFIQTITGNAAANVIVGGGGADTMTGGAGNDTYSVDNAGDKVIEAAGGGTDTVSASVSYALAADTSVNILYVSGGINGTAAVNLTGNGFIQTITGNAGANVIDGRGGNDTLTGGAGKDAFLFDTAPNTTSNDPTITDFNVPSDLFELSHAIFSAVTAGSGGSVSSNQFSIGASANSATDHLIYNSGTGALLYDADGSGSGAAVQFAKLATGLTTMSASDFKVV